MTANAPMPTRPRSFLRQETLYQQLYVWFVFVSALDLMLTSVILHLGGTEVNAIAARILQRWDMVGLVVFKFAVVAFIVCICEFIGRRKEHVGRRLAIAAVAISSVPVVWSALLLIVRGAQRAMHLATT